MNKDTATRTLEDRLRAIEDRLEIYNLIASHPPRFSAPCNYIFRLFFSD